MCFSASVSFGAATVLVTTGLYALHYASILRRSYQLLAWVPLLFGIQQVFEGRVWQMLGSGDSSTPFAMGFLFFSHFLWLWWIPLSSCLVEQDLIRKRIFLGVAIFGGMAGGLVYFTLLFNMDWLSVTVEGHSIVYDISSSYRGPISIGIPPSALYGLIILVPLIFSSQKNIRTFGGLAALSIVAASIFYGDAFVSVWCFFAAVLSLYLVYMLRSLSRNEGQ